MKSNHKGALLVALGSLMWATDALIRVPALGSVSSTFLVWVEHAIGIVALLPFLFFYKRQQIFGALARGQWFWSLVVGLGGSAAALYCFTQAFLTLHPTVNILLQKLQPILVVLMASVVLREKPQKSFYFWAVLAIFCGTGLSLSENASQNQPTNQSPTDWLRGIGYSLAATALWAASTVAGKKLLATTTATLATFWRFLWAFLGLSLGLIISEQPFPVDAFQNSTNVLGFVYLGIIPGIFAMIVYYAGMKQTSATTTTFVELIFPIGSMVLNAMFLDARLTPLQIAWALGLIAAVLMISLDETKASQKTLAELHTASAASDSQIRTHEAS